MEYKNLIIERRGHVTTVKLNRPEKLNALSRDLMGEIDELANSFHEDEKTRVVIFTGSGKNFSVGADLTNRQRSAQRESMPKH